MYDRNVGTDTRLGSTAGLNALWNNGGIMLRATGSLIPDSHDIRLLRDRNVWTFSCPLWKPGAFFGLIYETNSNYNFFKRRARPQSPGNNPKVRMFVFPDPRGWALFSGLAGHCS